jgi:hypothetical protein
LALATDRLWAYGEKALPDGIPQLRWRGLRDKARLNAVRLPSRSVMHQLKGATARAVFLEFKELKLDMNSTSFWQRGYGFRGVPANQLRTVAHYIRTQDKRPIRHR